MKLNIKTIDLLNTDWKIHPVGIRFEIDNGTYVFNLASTCDAEPSLEYIVAGETANVKVATTNALMQQLVLSKTSFTVTF